MTTTGLNELVRRYRKEGPDYINRIYGVIHKKTQKIDNFVDEFISKYQIPETIKSNIKCMYVLLEIQTELNRLKIKTFERQVESNKLNEYGGN